MNTLPRWKKWWSYISSVHIESTQSDFNEELHVYYSRGRYQLITKNAIYSYDDLYVNFKVAFKRLNIQKIAPKKILLLGLGLGSIPFMLENKFNTKAQYTAVEIDEAVIYLANKYTLSELKSPVNYICNDAMSFVNICEEQFDLICMDIFEDDIIPKQFETKDFLYSLKKLLNPNGIVLYNRLAHLKKDLHKTVSFRSEKFNKVFPNNDYYEVLGNWVLVGKI